MSAKRGLGRGLGALMRDDAVEEEPPPSSGIETVHTDRIQENPFQPRHQFDTDAFDELVRSVSESGVIQPLLVRKVNENYQLIAGERRLRAARAAGIKDVPVVVKEVSDQEALELALIENLQREDLNPLEEAEGYQMLMDRFQLTQDQVARRVGKARASVANSVRLLGLPADIRQLLVEKKLSSGHAKALLSLDLEEERRLYANRVVKEDLSVRVLEKLIEHAKDKPRAPRQGSTDDIPADYQAHLLDILHRHFGTSVHIAPSRTLTNGKKAKGHLQIDFFSNDELDRILGLFNLTEQP
ncbi:MAG: ParB/RepB/Spo0J family partition protein [Kiritimatiellae bacterium]|nr:ParB/RepB/Spo0J family partition protein [Kiritimatiellia bacterium]